MSVEALEEVGVDPIMTRATAERLEWITAQKVKAYFGGAVPKRYTEAIEAMEKLASGRGNTHPPESRVRHLSTCDPIDSSSVAKRSVQLTRGATGATVTPTKSCPTAA